MRRRTIISALAAGGAILPSVLRAQTGSGAPPHVAFVSASSQATIDPRNLQNFRKGLAENGLVDGRNIRMTYDFAEASAERLRDLCIRVVQSDAVMVVTAGPQAVRALLAAGMRKPIVVAIIGDPVASGVVASLARPGGSVTGLSMNDGELEAKRLEILKEAVPGLSRVVVLIETTMKHGDDLPEVSSAAKALGLEPLVMEVSDPAGYEAVFADAIARGANGMAVMASPFLNANRAQLIEPALRHRLPSIWEAAIFVRDGGLLSYGPNFPDMYRRSAGYVARILKGANPAELPVEQPTLFELFVNLRTAKALGLTIPPSILARADDVIE
jgi:putative tryptophan/tyrosine transport system substrate-binding protein